MPDRLLLLTSPLMSGPDVTALQFRLAQLGYDPGAADGAFGPLTAAAVRALQRDRGLEVDGIVGPATRTALIHASGKPAAPGHSAGAGSGNGASDPGLKALRWMTQRIGMGESGTNRNAITAEFGIGDVPWCMETVSLAFKHGAGIVLGEPQRPTGCWPDRGFAYVPYFQAWAQAAGHWRGRDASLAPGDVVVYEWAGDSVSDHVGIVAEVTGRDTFVAVEGNVDNVLKRKDRNRYSVAGFARILAS